MLENMAKIKFSHNWNNKINNKIFTTIRRSTPQKREYYCRGVGVIHNVLLNGVKQKEARLINVQEIPYQAIPDTLLMLDTGFSCMIDIHKLFKNFGITTETMVLILTFCDTKG